MKMNKSVKPIKKCGKCPMNLGKRCWACISPRDEWADGRECSARDDEAVLSKFARWQEDPTMIKRTVLRKIYLKKKGEETTCGLANERWSKA